MTADNVIEVLECCVGNIEPCADETIDKEALKNIKEWCEVADYMVCRLTEVSTSGFRLYESVNRISEVAEKKLRELKENIDECLGRLDNE